MRAVDVIERWWFVLQQHILVVPTWAVSLISIRNEQNLLSRSANLLHIKVLKEDNIGNVFASLQRAVNAGIVVLGEVDCQIQVHFGEAVGKGRSDYVPLRLSYSRCVQHFKLTWSTGMEYTYRHHQRLRSKVRTPSVQRHRYHREIDYPLRWPVLLQLACFGLLPCLVWLPLRL